MSAVRMLCRFSAVLALTGVFLITSPLPASADYCGFQGAYVYPGPFPLTLSFKGAISACPTSASKKVCVELWEVGVGFPRYSALCSSSSTSSSRNTALYTRECVPGRVYYAQAYSVRSTIRDDFALSGLITCVNTGCLQGSDAGADSRPQDQPASLLC